MIEKIFPTIEGNQPYEAGRSTPYFDLYTTDTPYTVKSHGFNTDWYVFDNFSQEPSFTSDNLIFSGNLPFLKYYSGKSWPVFVSPEFKNKQQFGFISSGYYHARTSFSSLQFYGRGYLTVNYIKGATTYNLVASQQLGLTKTERISAIMTGLNPDSFYYLEIKHWSEPKKNNTDHLLVVSHKDNTLLNRVPLSAGYVVSVTDFANYSGFITSTKIGNIESVSVNNVRNSLSKLTFTIPVVASSAAVGYKYVQKKAYFQDVANPNKKIQKFRMVEFFSGFKVGSTISTVTRFVGQIRDWSIIRNTSGKDIAIIECHDWSAFLLDGFNTGIPNVSDYLSHGYVDAIEGAIEGHSKPRAYDGWNFVEAVENILINGFIDPKIIYNKKKRLNVDDNIEEAFYHVHDYNLSNKIRLDRPLNYGNPLAVNKNTDDKYNWQFSVGEKLLDNIQALMDAYGFRYGFNNEGNFYTKSIKNPIKLKSIDDMVAPFDFRNERIGANKLYAVSLESNTPTEKIVATFQGAACKVILDVGPNYGTLHITLSNPTLGEIVNFQQSLAHDKNWSFLDGIDDSVGYNPCIFTVGAGLRYGTYTLNLTNISITTSTVSVNALLIYDHDYDTPDFKFYSGSTLSQQPVILSNLLSDSKASNIRNDIIVVGRLKGVKSQLSIDPDSTEEKDRIVNPNNPVSEHVISRAIDRISLGSVSNSNYVGRPLQMLIIEPKISTQERANWLARETAKRFNQFDKSLNPVFDININPLIEVEDYTKVWDIKLNTISTTQHNFWVRGITEVHDRSGHKTQVELESLEPWGSYFRYPSPSLKRMGFTVFANVKTYNTGMHSFKNNEYCRLKGIITDGTNVSTIQVEYLKEYFPNEVLDSGKAERIFAEQGYMKIKTELIKYSKKIRFSGPAFVSGHTEPWTITRMDFGGLTRGMYNTSTVALGTLTTKEKLIDLSVSPFAQEDFGVAPAIEFDLLYPGYIQVTVKSNQGVLLDSLTGNEVPEFENNWDFFEPGKYFFSWGMFDRIGKHNEVNSWVGIREGGPLDVPGANYDVFAPPGETSALTRPGPFWDEYSIGQGFYAHNLFKKVYSTYNFNVRYRDLTRVNFPTEDVVKNIRPIYLSLHKQGDGIFLPDRPFEQISLMPNSSFHDPTAGQVGTLWWNNTQKIDLKERSVSFHTYGKFYTGQENNGLGLKINLREGIRFISSGSKSRVCKLEVTRYIFTFAQTYLSRWELTNVNTGQGRYTSPKSDTFLIDSLEDNIIDNDTFNYVINGNDGLDLFIKPPSVGFFTPGIVQHLNSILGEGIIFGEQTFIDKIYSLSICHLHLFRFRAIDMSGVRSDYKLSLLWKPFEMHNTKSDFDNNIAKTSPYGGDPYEAALFHSRGYAGEILYFDLAFHERDVFLPHAKNIKENSKLQVNTQSLMGITVFGKYDG